MRLIGLVLAIVLALVPLAVEGQQAAKVYRIGFLGLPSAADYAQNVEAFRNRLRDLGYEEGKNISIEYRWAEGRDDRLPALAAELVRLNPDVLVTHAIPGIRAAQQATSTIPIVMGASSDPVRLGLVKSLAKPGGNITGVSLQLIDLAAKRLELLLETIPKLRQVAVLSNLANPTGREAAKETEVAGRTLGLRVRSFKIVRESNELEREFAAIVRERPGALIVIPDFLICWSCQNNARIVEFALRNRLPAMGGERGFVAAGGLISYGGDFLEGWRLAARYVDRILKGAKPADLPVEQPTKFDLVINLKTAKAIGLTIPQSLLLQATEVIE
jgi:putative ABC transport system substrate-binding protein